MATGEEDNEQAEDTRKLGKKKEADAELKSTVLGVSGPAPGSSPGSSTGPSPSKIELAETQHGVTANERPGGHANAARASALGTQETLASAGSGPAQSRPPATEEEVAFPPGTRINQYEIIRELGRGGMGRVLLARDTVLGRRVALKFLVTTTKHVNQRFLIEARTTAQLSHENIVIIHEVNEHQGAPFMVLEYLEGEALSDFMRNRRLTPSRVIQIMVPVVRALVRAHEAGIIHRDLKPDNIFITDSGQVKVLDFGIAKIFEDREQDASTTGAKLPEADLSSMRGMQLTGEGAILGTMPYMAPEQWGYAEVCNQTDIWAIGIILFEMLTGEHPLAPLTPTVLQIAAGSLDEPMPSVGARIADLPLDLVQIVDRCLNKRVEHRFGSSSELLERLEALLPERQGTTLEEGENPYPGLVAFQEGDAGRFFGRNRDIIRSVKMLREQPIVGIVGPSGVGKSSLVRAGIVPALKESGEHWDSFTLRPGRAPLTALANLLNPMTASRPSPAQDADEPITEQESLVQRLREEPGYAGYLLRRRARKHETQIVVFVDQFEELYTLAPDADERRAFAAALLGIADDNLSPLRVIISVRADFLDRAGEHPDFLDALSHGLLFLQPPTRQGIREALTNPIEMAGYHFESPELVSDMLDALAASPGALPLLQFAAARLWEERDQSRKLLTEASYEAMGGVAGTLARHASETLESLGPKQQALVRTICQRLVTPDGTRAIVDISELKELGTAPKEVDSLIRLLVRSRLLVVQQRGDGAEPAVELVHESLIKEWPALRLWLEEDAETSAFLELLRSAARQWDQQGRPDGLLWTGEAMREAQRFCRRYDGDLTATERDFIDKVLDKAARAGRIRRRITMAAVALTIALFVAGSVVLVYVRNAQKDAEKSAAAAVVEKERSQAAELKVRDQLEVIQQKEEARRLAEQEAEKGREKVQMTQEELKEALEVARAAQAQAEAAREAAQREADNANRTAKELAATAKKLEQTAEKERVAKQELERLVKARDKELAKLKAQGKKIIKVLD